MTRLIIVLVIMALAGLRGEGEQQRSAPATPADLLWIDVVAVDRRGGVVMDLKPAEFEVWIGGYRIPVEEVAVRSEGDGGSGRTMVLLLDNVTSDPLLVSRVKDVARQFVKRVLPGDAMAVISLGGDGMKSTHDQSELLRAVDGYHAQGFPFRLEDVGQQVLNTVTTLSRQLAEAPGGRKTIVAIGNAWLLDRPLPPPGASRDLRSEWIAAMRAAASAKVSLYVIDPSGVGRRQMIGGGDSGFAHETGGHAFLNTNDLGDVVARIWREAGSYYLLGVVDPPIQRKAELRELEVKVLRRGVTVRARRELAPGPM